MEGCIEVTKKGQMGYRIRDYCFIDNDFALGKKSTILKYTHLKYSITVQFTFLLFFTNFE